MTGEDDNLLTRLAALSAERTAAAEAFVAMLARHGQVNARADVVYRCTHRCALARIYSTNAGVIVHRSRYKLSPKINEASSSPSGRTKNTEDGDRRWRATTYFLDQAGNVTLDCDHLRQKVLDVDTVAADARARRGLVVVVGE